MVVISSVLRKKYKNRKERIKKMQRENRYSIDIQKIVLIIAIVSYIIIVICILLSRASSTQRVYPQGPVDVCPDFWKDEGSSLGRDCLNSPSNPMYFNGLKNDYKDNKGDLPHSNISFDINKGTLNFTKASECDKWCFTKKYHISWNGISYGNNIVDKNCKCKEIVTEEDKQPGNSKDQYGITISMTFIFLLFWVIGIGIEYQFNFIKRYYSSATSSPWIEILIFPIALLCILPAKLFGLLMNGVSLGYETFLSPIFLPIYLAIFVIYQKQFLLISFVASIIFVVIMVQLRKYNENAGFLFVSSTLFTIAFSIFIVLLTKKLGFNQAMRNSMAFVNRDNIDMLPQRALENLFFQNLDDNASIKIMSNIIIGVIIYLPLIVLIVITAVLLHLYNTAGTFLKPIISEKGFALLNLFCYWFPAYIVYQTCSEYVSAVTMPILLLCGIYFFAIEWT